MHRRSIRFKCKSERVWLPSCTWSFDRVFVRNKEEGKSRAKCGSFESNPLRIVTLHSHKQTNKQTIHPSERIKLKKLLENRAELQSNDPSSLRCLPLSPHRLIPKNLLPQEHIHRQRHQREIAHPVQHLRVRKPRIPHRSSPSLLHRHVRHESRESLHRRAHEAHQPHQNMAEQHRPDIQPRDVG